LSVEVIGILRDGLGGRLLLRFGFGVEVLLVLLDVGRDDFTPSVGAEGVDVFVLRDLDGLQERLGEIREGGSDARFYFATSNGGEEAGLCRGQITSGKIVAGEEIREVATEILSGFALRLFAGVGAAELEMAGLPRSAAAAAIGISESTQRRAVRGGKCGHGSLLELLNFESRIGLNDILGMRTEKEKKGRSKTGHNKTEKNWVKPASATARKEKPRQEPGCGFIRQLF
jgi:hypothetical protein